MKNKEIYERALAHALEFSPGVPDTISVAMERIEERTRELFTLANNVDEEYFGVCANTPVVAGTSADLKDVVKPLFTVDRVTKVVVYDKGTSAYNNGDEVSIVPVNDPDVATAPRALLRNWVIIGWAGELANVAKIQVSYARQPLPIDPTTGPDTENELPVQFQGLLVLDLAKDMLARTVSIEPGSKQAALEYLGGKEEKLLAAFLAHVANFAGSRTSRFNSHGASA